METKRIFTLIVRGDGDNSLGRMLPRIYDESLTAYSVWPKIILRAFLYTDSKRSSRYDGSAAQTAEAYSMTDLTKLQ